MSKITNYGDANEVKISIRLSRQQIFYLETNAATYGMSISAYIRSIIDYYRFTRSSRYEHTMSDSNDKL